MTFAARRRFLCVVALCAWTTAVAHPAAPDGGGATYSRIIVRDGRFVTQDTGRPFTPLGVNYYRVGALEHGKKEHATFCPGYYDRTFIESMMTQLAAWGFNTVRTFQVYNVGPNGILTSPDAREISPQYLDNVIDFLQRAKRHGIHVIFTWGIWNQNSKWWSSTPLPDETKYGFADNWTPDMGINNFRLCLTAVRTRANAITALINAIKSKDPELLAVVLSWELENEICFDATRPPFSTRHGTFSFAGKSYDLASDTDAQALMNVMVEHWAACCAAAVHRADPDALVSAGLFTFAAVKRGGPGTLSKDRTRDSRIPADPSALLKTPGLDFLDLHLYAWKTADEGIRDHVTRDLKSIAGDQLLAEAQTLGKPVLIGETGVFAHYLRTLPNHGIDHKSGVECLRQQLQVLKDHRFAGVLYWPYGNPDSTANDEIPALCLFPQYADVIRDVWSRE